MSTKNTETELKQTAREHIQRAAAALGSLGPDAQRIGWMLEDSLMYLDELDQKDAGRGAEFSSAETATLDDSTQLDALSKLVNT